MRAALVLLAVSGAVGCRHRQPIREEYKVTDSEAAACHEQIAMLEDMRKRIGYSGATWSIAEASLDECLRRRREYEEKRARGEPATQDEIWRAAVDKKRREREELERAHVAAFTRNDYQVAYSALVCAYGSARAETLKEIAKEKHYSDIGGAVNLSRRYQWQQLLRFLDEQEERLLAALKNATISPLRCNDATVTRFAGCLSVGILERVQRLDVEVKDGCEQSGAIVDLILRASPRG